MTEKRPQTESEIVEYVRSIDARAPEDLHRRIETLISEPSSERGRGSQSNRLLGRPLALGWRLAGGFALVAVVAALVLGLTSGGSGGLTVRETSALTQRPATSGAPAENPHNGTQLAAALDGVAFPYWGERFGWSSTGARTDRIGGRTVMTVFYANDRGQRIGYAIVSGTPPPHASGGVVVWHRGESYRLLSGQGLSIVTWLRDGHLCVVAGRGVSGATLLALASWHEPGTVAS